MGGDQYGLILQLRIMDQFLKELPGSLDDIIDSLSVRRSLEPIDIREEKVIILKAGRYGEITGDATLTVPAAPGVLHQPRIFDYRDFLPMKSGGGFRNDHSSLLGPGERAGV